MELDKQFDSICGRFLKIQQKYDEVVEAFRTFCTKKRQLSDLFQPLDPDDDGREQDEGAAPEPYPSEADKARIREAIEGASDAVLAAMLRKTKPDLGALSDEMRMVFTARTAFDEAAKRLEEKSNG